MNDIKCLNLTLEDILKQYGNYIVYFLADAGFHSKYIFELLEKYNIKQLIPKNIRNNKKYQKENGEKLTYAEKIKIQFEDFSRTDREKYKIRS